MRGLRKNFAVALCRFGSVGQVDAKHEASARSAEPLGFLVLHVADVLDKEVYADVIGCLVLSACVEHHEVAGVVLLT